MVTPSLNSLEIVNVGSVGVLRGHTALGFAAARGHRQAVELLLAAKADPTLRDVHGHSPIWAATDRGHHGLAQALAERVQGPTTGGQ